MHRRILHYLHKEFTGLHEAAFLLAGSAFLSQVLALFRDRLLASSFGSGVELDIYYASFKVPDFLFASIASFVSVTVLIPFIVDRLHENNSTEAKKFLNSVFTAYCATISLVSIIAWFVMPYLAGVIVPGFSADEQTSFIVLSRILLLSPVLLGLSNLLGSVTQAYKKFFVFALTPLVYNFGIIVGIIFFYPYFGLPGLVYGVVLGAFLHLAIQLPVLLKIGFFPKFTSDFDFKTLKSVILISLPRTLALATDKISLLVLAAYGSLMVAGSISLFNLALNLQSVPLAVVGVSYSVAAFPALAQLFRQGNLEEFKSKVETAVRHIVFWSMPSMVLFIVLRAQIIRVLYGAGRFDWNDTRLTAASLALFALSVVAQGLIILFTRAYYAGGKTMRPLIVNAGTSLVTIILAYLFMNCFTSSLFFRQSLETILRVKDVSNTIMLTLPLAYSLGYILNAILLWYYFVKDFGGLGYAVLRSFMQSLTASVVGGFVTYFGLNLFENFLKLHTTIGVFAQGFFAGAIGIIFIIIILKLFHNEEFISVSEAVGKRIWRNKTAVVEQNI